jgi:hypothetical protein
VESQRAEREAKKLKKVWRSQTRVDDLCLVFFPIVFGLFNAVYWSVCLNNEPYEVEFIPPQKSTKLY